MTNEPAEALSDLVAIHAHPEKVAGIKVGRQRCSECGHALECLNVEGGRSRVQFKTDQQVRILRCGERGEIGPVWPDRLLPLTLVDVFEVGQPAACPEVRRPVFWSRRGAASHGDYSLYSEQCGQPDGIAQVRVVLPGNRQVGMQRVAPGVQCSHAKSVRGDLIQPISPASLACQQGCDVAVRVRRVASDAHFDIGYFGRIVLQPEQDVGERLIQEGLEYNTNPRRERICHLRRSLQSSWLWLCASEYVG